MSHFQLLPFDIFERIIKYSFDTYDRRHRISVRGALSLMRSCHSCRYALMEVAFNHLFLDGMLNTLQLYFLSSYDCINPLNYPLDRLVKSFKITLGSWDDIFSGKVGAWMRSSGFAEVRLANLDHFAFGVYSPLPGGTDITSYGPEAMHEVVSFFQLLRQIMPSIRKTEINHCGLKWPVSDNAVSLLAENEVLEMLRYANSMGFVCHGLSTYFKHSDVFANGILTSLSYFISTDADNDSFMEVLRLNAANITSVSISFLPLTYVKDIIKRDDGEPVVYPCLRSLALKYIETVDTRLELTSQLTDVSPDTIHFPVLKSLDLSQGSYPFNGNIFARGSNDTLEELKISFMTSDISNHLVQSILSTQLVNLKKISLGYNDTYGKSLNVFPGTQRYSNMRQFLRTLLRPATKLMQLEISIPAELPLYLEELSCLEFKSLRYLVFLRSKFEFPDILYIIQKTPYLRRLTCELYDIPPKIEEVLSTDLPGYMDEHCPLNSHFFELRVKNCTREALKNHIELAVLLAIACPNFSVIVGGNYHPSEVQRLINDLLKTSTYQNYANVGMRLLAKKLI